MQWAATQIEVKQEPEFECLIAICDIEAVLFCISYRFIKVIVVVLIEHHPAAS